MVPTPTTPKGLSQQEALYRGVALSFLDKLKQANGHLNIYSGKMRLDNGVEIYCNVCFNRVDFQISVPTVISPAKPKIIEEIFYGFATHPRSSMYPTGANFSKILESGNYENLPTSITHERPDGSTYTTPITTMFPLYDDDNGTMMVYKDGDDWKAKVPSGDNYGIHAWTSEKETVTWRGWQGITLGNSRETSVEGITQMDVQTTYNTFYTPLFGNIYVDGEAIPVPGKVRGAGVSSVGKVFISTVNYTQYDFVGIGSNEVNPDGLDWLYDNPDSVIDDSNKAGKVGNYYDELYVKATAGVPYAVNGRVRYATSGITNQDVASVDGWLRIGHRISQITNLSVWFSDDGKSAVEDGGSWSWTFAATPNADKEVSQGTFTSRFTPRVDETNHKVTVVKGGFVTGDMSWKKMFMQSQYAEVSYYINDRSAYGGIPNADGDEYGLVPVVFQIRPDPTGYYIETNHTVVGYTHTYTFTAIKFKSGPYQWSGATPIDAIGQVAQLILEARCVRNSSLAKTVNVSVTDKCGFTASTSFVEPVREGIAVDDYSQSCDPVLDWGYWCNFGWDTIEYPDDVTMIWYGNGNACCANDPRCPASVSCRDGGSITSWVVDDHIQVKYIKRITRIVCT